MVLVNGFVGSEHDSSLLDLPKGMHPQPSKASCSMGIISREATFVLFHWQEQRQSFVSEPAQKREMGPIDRGDLFIAKLLAQPQNRNRPNQSHNPRIVRLSAKRTLTDDRPPRFILPP